VARATGVITLVLNEIFLFGCPLARWVNGFGELQWNIVGVVYGVSEKQYGGRPSEVEIT
jgi:hypothetical protein